MYLDQIKKITIIGMGTMGPDISLSFALAGYDVLGLDIEQSVLNHAITRIASNCKQMVDGKFIQSSDVASIQSRILLSLDWEAGVSVADYITEAVPENIEIKREIFRRCGEICSEQVVVASNTSSMSINEIASKMKNPQRAIVTHWIIPAHLTPVVEVAPGEKTSKTTSELTFSLLKKVGKIPVFCRENPGFIHNYIQLAMVQAALALIDQGICSPKDVDTVIENGFALRLAKTGPLKFADMAGLDTFLNVLKYMYEKTGHPIYKPSRILQEKVSKGDLGVKTKKGFYEYPDENVDKFIQNTNFTIMAILDTLKKF